MATIVRGHHYDTRDFVTGENLTRLVKDAQITGLTVDDLGSGLAWSSAHTAPTNAAYGWLTSVYEQPLYTSGPTYVDFHVLIRVPSIAAATNSSFGDVALISPHRLESKRMVTIQWTGIPFDAGGPMWFKWDTNPGPTLTVAGRDARAVSHLGVYLGQAGTGASNPYNNHRFVLKGIAPCYIKFGIGSNLSMLPHYYAHLTSDEQWTHAAGTEFDPVFLFPLTNKYDAAYNLLQPCYLFGGPLWRS